ncbi:MAG: hypothetical protein HFJ80_02030 [Clostridiales bacterium]|nr:hypothetical protein [Clostridiales bacterium]
MLVVGDQCLAMLKAVGEVFHGAKCQRCVVHFCRHVIFLRPAHQGEMPKGPFILRKA